jgi:DDE_Tnp_1-associated
VRSSVHPDSLFGRLRTLPDPRRRQARQYPLPSILAALLLGALNGQTSGFGAWSWAREHWSAIWQPLGFRSPHCPVYTTVWTVLQRIDAERLDRIISDWLEEVLGHPPGGVSVDGKTLRGSRRGDLPGLKLVAMAHHELGTVLSQCQLADGAGEVSAALALLRAMPLAGQVVTLDAGLLSAEATQVVTVQGGDYVGVVKENHPVVKAVLDEWVQDAVVSPLRLASARRTDGGQGARAEGNP